MPQLSTDPAWGPEDYVRNCAKNQLETYGVPEILDAAYLEKEIDILERITLDAEKTDTSDGFFIQRIKEWISSVRRGGCNQFDIQNFLRGLFRARSDSDFGFVDDHPLILALRRLDLLTDSPAHTKLDVPIHAIKLKKDPFPSYGRIVEMPRESEQISPPSSNLVLANPEEPCESNIQPLSPRHPGFRLSPRDALVLAVSAGLYFLAHAFQPAFAWLIPFVVVHFFFFCNMLRPGTRLELIWAAWFVAQLVGWAVWKGELALLPVLAVQMPVTLVVTILTLRSPDYHGIFWRTINPAWADKSA